ncbi:MAG: hypothetical protein M3Q44_03525 [bacterium]|nr:hypothetical protein [bacterium]
MISVTELEQHIIDEVPNLKKIEAYSYLQALLRVIGIGISDVQIQNIVLEILYKETSPQFFTITATKSGSITNSFLGQNPGSEIYHVLNMCSRLNRLLQIELILNVEVKTGVMLVRKIHFEEALAATVLHDFRKCGGVSDFDDSKSDPYHGQKGAEIFTKYAKKTTLEDSRIQRIASIIRYHDGRFSPLLRDKYSHSALSLQEILHEETQDPLATLLSYQVHSLDMLTSNGLTPSPSEPERKLFLQYLMLTNEYLNCAD